MFLSVLAGLVLLAGALAGHPPSASANQTHRPAGKACFWAGPAYGGQQAFFDGSDTGNHSLAWISPQSGWNHTGNHLVYLWNFTYLSPGQTIQMGPFGGSITIY